MLVYDLKGWRPTRVTFLPMPISTVALYQIRGLSMETVRKAFPDAFQVRYIRVLRDWYPARTK